MVAGVSWQAGSHWHSVRYPSNKETMMNEDEYINGLPYINYIPIHCCLTTCPFPVREAHGSRQVHQRLHYLHPWRSNWQHSTPQDWQHDAESASLKGEKNELNTGNTKLKGKWHTSGSQREFFFSARTSILPVPDRIRNEHNKVWSWHLYFLLSKDTMRICRVQFARLAIFASRPSKLVHI